MVWFVVFALSDLPLSTRPMCAHLEYAQHVVALLEFRAWLFIVICASNAVVTRVFLDSCPSVGTAAPSFLSCFCVVISEYGSYCVSSHPR